MSTPFPLQHTDIRGRVWHPFAVAFTSGAGSYSFHVFAMTHEHALLQVTALRATARLDDAASSPYPPRGSEWTSHAVAFDNPCGLFTFVINAQDRDHALQQVAALRETATLIGQISDVIEP